MFKLVSVGRLVVCPIRRSLEYRAGVELWKRIVGTVGRDVINVRCKVSPLNHAGKL